MIKNVEFLKNSEKEQYLLLVAKLSKNRKFNYILKLFLKNSEIKQ